MANSYMTDNMLVEAFLQDLHRRECLFKLPMEEVLEIEKTVMLIVKDYLPKQIRYLASKNRKYFSVKEVVNAGSYFEGTKIKLPDEFDFMFVLSEMSSEDFVTIAAGCKPGYANVKVSNTGYWYSKGISFTPEKEFEITLLSFNAFLRQAVAMVPEQKGKYGNLKYKKVNVRGKPYSIFSHVQTAYFEWTRNSPFDDSEDLLYNRSDANIETFDVCIDMMTCCHLPLQMFHTILPDTAMADWMLKNNGCHIVLKSCDNDRCVENETFCRLISYTKSENIKMESLDENWKIVYKCAKWIFSYLEFSGIDSYKLKTSVLHLSSKFGHVEIDRGFVLLLTSLSNSARKRRLACYFNDTLNIWSISESYQFYVKWQLFLLLKLFKNSNNLIATQNNMNMLTNILNLWVHATCRRAFQLSQNERQNLNIHSLETFNSQGNLFLEIVDEIGPTMKKLGHLKWIPFQMKCNILVDVFKILCSKLLDRISLLLHRFFKPISNTLTCKREHKAN